METAPDSVSLYVLAPGSRVTAEPVVRVAIWRINREVINGQYAVRGEAAPMQHAPCIL